VVFAIKGETSISWRLGSAPSGGTRRVPVESLGVGSVVEEARVRDQEDSSGRGSAHGRAASGLQRRGAKRSSFGRQPSIGFARSGKMPGSVVLLSATAPFAFRDRRTRGVGEDQVIGAESANDPPRFSCTSGASAAPRPCAEWQYADRKGMPDANAAPGGPKQTGRRLEASCEANLRLA